MTIAKQLALVLVKEIIANKRSSHISPDYALRNEVCSARHSIHWSLMALSFSAVPR